MLLPTIFAFTLPFFLTLSIAANEISLRAQVGSYEFIDLSRLPVSKSTRMERLPALPEYCAEQRAACTSGELLTYKVYYSDCGR